MAQLIFKEDEHAYFVNEKRIPCVSDIVGILGEDLDDSDVELSVERAADRGTTCHAVIAEMLVGNTDVEYPGAYATYIDAVLLFLSEHSIIPLAIETPIYSDSMGLAGTPDLLCEYDGALAVVDYKFVSQVAKAKVKAQLNAYRRMFEDNGIFPEKLFAIQFLRDGTYRAYPVAISDVEVDACLKIRDLKTKKYARGKID